MSNNNIRISEFANICNTTSRTIRFYDNIGILKADYIDPSSGYRYYAKEKVLEFHKITSLKQIGFTIEEIRTILMSASDSDILQILREKAKSLSDAHENCVKTISEYERRINVYNERTKKLDIVKDTETNTIFLDNGNISTTVRCLSKDLDLCYSLLWNLISVEGYVNLDLEDICRIIDSSKIVQLGYGSAKGENKLMKAAEEACKNLSRSSGIMITLVVPMGISISDINEVVEKIEEEVGLGKSCTSVLFGVVFSQDLEDEVNITVLKRD